MAPKRKAKASVRPPQLPPAVMSPRKTRSATARKRADSPAAATAPARAPSKKVKLSSEGNAKKRSDGAKGKGGEDVKAKDKASDAEEETPVVPPPAAGGGGGGGGSSKTVIVEACKQCNSFKTRAIKVKEGLEGAVPGIVVTINPDKPRRGCFEIREESGQVFVSLLNMPRPFTPMKKLDMDEVIEDIVKKIT